VYKRQGIPAVRELVAGSGRFGIENRTRGTTIEVSCELSERQRRIVLAGGALSAVQNGAI
jgi:16S rRNA G966 N2-methylase RsmD